MKKIIWIIFVLCCSIPLSNQIKKHEANLLQPDIAKRVIRFHVRANSDKKADQELKLQVRDAVGEKLGPLLKNSNSRKESEQIIRLHLEELKECAKQVLRNQNCKDSVTISMKNTKFPEKKYGIYTFPKGYYKALEIELGKAEGHNWWCVMYPNICFANSLYEEPTQREGVDLKKVLTPQEYDSIMRQDTVQVCCRYVTILNPVLERIRGKG